MRLQLRSFGLIMALFLASGCDQFSDAPPTSTSTESAEVKGTVKVVGKLVNNGTVSFHSADIRRATKDVVVPIHKDGTFSAKTVVGTNQVIVDCRELNSKKNIQLQEAADQAFTIKPGTYEIEIKIPPN